MDPKLFLVFMAGLTIGTETGRKIIAKAIAGAIVVLAVYGGMMLLHRFGNITF